MKKSILVAATLMLGTTGLFATSSYAASNLVAYYSTGGATEQLAKNLAGSINAHVLTIIKSASLGYSTNSMLDLRAPKIISLSTLFLAHPSDTMGRSQQLK